MPRYLDLYPSISLPTRGRRFAVRLLLRAGPTTLTWIAAFCALLVCTIAQAGEPHVLLPGNDAWIGEILRQAAKDAACQWEGASIEKSRVIARFECASAPSEVTLVHPEEGAPGATAAGPHFAVIAAPSCPGMLVDGVRRALQASRHESPWARPTLAPRPQERASRSRLRAMFLGPMGQEGQGEKGVALLLLGAVVAACLRDRPSRLRIVRAAIVGCVALVARLLVPRVPSNFYSDLSSPYPTFRNDPEYRHPIYDSLSGLFGSPQTPIFANIVMGSLSAAFIYLAMTTPRQEPCKGDPDWDRPGPQQLALPMAAAVALLPLYVRTSATDATAVAALFFLSVGGWLFCRALGRPSWIDTTGVVCAAWLVGATRIELGLAPLLWLLVAAHVHGPARVRRRIAPAALLLAAVAAGCTLTRQLAVGAPNAELGFRASGILGYVRALPLCLAVPGEMVPWLIRLGVLAVVLVSIKQKRHGVVLVYVAGTVLFTLPYLFVEGFSQLASAPLETWSVARYALLWHLLPTYFGVWGATIVLSRTWWLRSGIDRAIVAALLCASAIPSLGRLESYQKEYLFLREVLRTDVTDRPIVAGWQKSAGVDLQDSLALPHYLLATPDRPREWIVVNESTTDSGALPSRPVLYFRNTLAQVQLSAAASGQTADALRDALGRFRRLRTQAESKGTPIQLSSSTTLTPTQPALAADGPVQLGIFSLER
ncbi:MAG: hypothetical protein HY898_24085 [Deltaproteobacteria bacterium]|nr:hypothetical protein [Deltaproteobacteria bacterium]